MKQLIFIILIITSVSCSTTYNILITDYIEVTMKDNSRDTIKSVYFDNTVIDEYVQEWLLKQNNIDPKKVLSTKTIRKDRRKVYK
jgi:hypothetical protein